jgi:hypothetical protein
VAIDGADNLYIADFGDYEIRKVTPDGTITTIAGTGTKCQAAPACGDGGLATSAQMQPYGVAVDSRGNVYIGDFGDNEVRKVAGGTISRGPAGPVGAPGAPGYDGRLVLVAYSAPANRGHITVRYALTNSAQVTLSVQAARAHRTIIAHSHGHEGLGVLNWNERIRGKHVRHGRYTLIVTATIAGRDASSAIRVSL